MSWLFISIRKVPREVLKNLKIRPRFKHFLGTFRMLINGKCRVGRTGFLTSLSIGRKFQVFGCGLEPMKVRRMNSAKM